MRFILQTSITDEWLVTVVKLWFSIEEAAVLKFIQIIKF
jgi:hypothetical protein